MNLPPELIENAVYKGEDRPALSCVFFDRENKCLVATDGFILAVLPLQDEDFEPEDISGLIPVQAISEARKLRGRLRLLADTVIVVPQSGDSQLTLTRPQHRFPDWKYLVDGTGLDLTRDWEVFAINAEELYRLSKALGPKNRPKRDKRFSHGLRLWLTHNRYNPRNEAILVKPIQSDGGGYGLIFPMSKYSNSPTPSQADSKDDPYLVLRELRGHLEEAIASAEVYTLQGKELQRVAVALGVRLEKGE